MKSTFIYKDIFSALFKMAGVFGLIVFILIILFVSLLIFKDQKSSTKVIINEKYNEITDFIPVGMLNQTGLGSQSSASIT
ncbi:MAG: hypothetical protein CVV22_12605 [Ignavibacteriae bacterium HGW-Ignavibacteriae-1]|jgi:hypothetical protein|nr:MAG: hypothetical protein CVV22_12605 [Ignavibacteriae bacterium HGW-Ignavibacteriae-1]